jgi:hypothetical protein
MKEINRDGQDEQDKRRFQISDVKPNAVILFLT